MRHNQIVCRLLGLTIGAVKSEDDTIGLHVGDSRVLDEDMQKLLSGEIGRLVWMNRTEARLLISALEALLNEGE